MIFIDMFENKKIYHDKKGYAIIWVNGKSVKLHVYIWEKAHGKKPKGYDIHHMDSNKANYCLENLVLLTKQEHSRIHAGWVKTNGEWSHKRCSGCNQTLPLDRFYKRNDKLSALCKKCHLKDLKKRMENPIFGTNIKNYKKEYFQKHYEHKRGGKNDIH